MSGGNISIKNDFDKKDRAGLLGKKVLVKDEYNIVLSVDVNTKYLKCAMRFHNASDEQAILKIWISDNIIPALVDNIQSEIKLGPRSTYIEKDVTIGMGEKLIASTDKDNCVICRIEGYDNRTF